MKLGKRKLAVIAGAAVVFIAGIVAAALGQTDLLLLLVVAVQIAGFALVLLVVITVNQRIQQRVERLERAPVTASQSPDMASESPTTMPQAHAEQLLRAIAAQHARLEASQDQLARRVDRLLDRSDEG